MLDEIVHRHKQQRRNRMKAKTKVKAGFMEALTIYG